MPFASHDASVDPYPDPVERVLLDQVIRTDYGQFDIIWSDDGGFDGIFERFFDGQVNGLVGASDPDGVYVHFGRRSGGSPVRIVLLDEPPGSDSDYLWEDIVEVSFTLPESGQMRWTSWAGETSGELSNVPPGSYRLRVNAKGRDEGHGGEFSQHPVDSYLLQFWPEPPRPDAILRSGSRDAEYWQTAIGSRR